MPSVSKSFLLRCGDLSAGEGGHGLLLLDHGDALMSELFTVFRERPENFLEICLVVDTVINVFIDLDVARDALICCSKYYSTIRHFIYVHSMVQYPIN